MSSCWDPGQWSDLYLGHHWACGREEKTWQTMLALKASAEKKCELIISPTFHSPSTGCLLAIVNIILSNYNDNEKNYTKSHLLRT